MRITRYCKYLLTLLLLVNLPQFTQAVNRVNCDNDSLYISLLTCSAGDEIYSAYGHSAVRVRDLRNGFDVVFNYGTFDFGTPFFVPKFLSGTLDYMLSTSSFSRFMYIYEREGRGVTERELIMSTAQKNEVELFLLENLKPQNRFYRYDFFFDNCATRIRDFALKIADVKTDSCKRINPGETFRSCLHEYVGTEKWYGTGIDLILGVRADKPVSDYDKAMLPDHLEALLLKERLLGEPIVLLERQELGQTASFVPSPAIVALVLFLIVIAACVYEVKSGRRLQWLDYALFAVMVLLSLLFWFLWIVSEIKITSYNYNVLWASILYIPMIVAMIKRRTKLTRIMAIANLSMIGAYFILIICGIQYAPTLAVSLALCLAFRNLCYILPKHVREIKK